MRRIPEIKKVDYSDTQSILIEKLNSNFSNIHRLDGGPMGSRGVTGTTGPYGINGIPGPYGNKGIRGTRWFLSDDPPVGGYGDSMIIGDYWINSSSNNNISRFFSTGWDPTTYDLSSRSPFLRLSEISSNFGATGGRSIVYKNSPERSTFSFSDSPTDSGSSNHEGSSLIIPVKGSVSGGINLLEFSRGDLNDGSSLNYLNNPVMKFKDAGSINSDLLFILPSGRFNVETQEGPAGMDHSISISTSNALNLVSSNFIMSSYLDSGKGFGINSSGSINMNTQGLFYPTYSNLDYTTNGIIRIYSKLTSTYLNDLNPAIKVSSRIDSISGTGSISTSFRLGTSGSTLAQRKDSNIFRIYSYGSINRFAVNGNGVIYREKESKKITRLSDYGTNLESDRFWCNLGNSTYINTSSKTICTGSNTNEVIVKPIGVASGKELSIGISLITINNCSYLRNLKEIGETIKIRVRTADTGFLIHSVGITNVTSNTTAAGGAYPTGSKKYDFTNPCAFVDFNITREASVNAGNRVTYKSSSGEVGFFTT